MDYYVAVPGSKEAQYRLITHISYKRLYSNSVNFDLKEVHSDLLKKLGKADVSRINSSKIHAVGNRDNFTLKYYDNDANLQAPMLRIEGSKFFSQGSLTVDVYWDEPGNQLTEKYRKQKKEDERIVEKKKGKADIDF